MDFGAKQVQTDYQSHSKLHLAVFAYELDFLIGHALRSCFVWATYFKLYVSVDGKKMAEREHLDPAAAHGSAKEDIEIIERLRVMLDLISDASI